MSVENIIARIAYENYTSPCEVKLKIEDVALKGLMSEDERIRSFWLSVPKKGDYPKAEEIIFYICFIINKTGNKNTVSRKTPYHFYF